MDALADAHFIRPIWLIAVPVVIGVWLWQRRQSDVMRGWRAQIDEELLEAITVRPGQAHSWWSRPASWQLIAWVTAVVSLAGPTWQREPSPFADDATPLLVLLKASDTMSLPSPAPSRMENAQLKIADLAEARRGEPLGLMAYAGSAHLILPPTKDTRVVATMARNVRPDIMPEPGDSLTAALAAAKRILDEGEQGGTVVVVADSVSESESELEQTAAAFPRGAIQFLALTPEGTPERASLDAAATALGGRVESLSADGRDVDRVVRAASSHTSSGLAGQTERWQESGYWLIPIVAGLIALSFRRVEPRVSEVPA